ncbi:MAG TPA: NnrU family protein [Balneolales bacterium]|nr:NnrU family protein [Balneolales bacterium]
MRRLLALFYGIISYVVFLGSFLYAIAFIGDFAVLKTINTGVEGPIVLSLIIDAGLLSIFALQHSIMARQGFKKWWAKFIPKPIERSTFVLASSLALILIFWQWRPVNAVIWDVGNGAAQTVIYGIYAVGWLIVLFGTFLINHFNLFGLQQVYRYMRNQKPLPPEFKKPFFYKVVRHPLMFGFIVAFWATPTMTVGHLLFSIATTGYILVAIQLEERDLVSFHGEDYIRYQQEVSQIIPMPPRKVMITNPAQENYTD